VTVPGTITSITVTRTIAPISPAILFALSTSVIISLSRPVPTAPIPVSVPLVANRLIGTFCALRGSSGGLLVGILSIPFLAFSSICAVDASNGWCVILASFLILPSFVILASSVILSSSIIRVKLAVIVSHLVASTLVVIPVISTRSVAFLTVVAPIAVTRVAAGTTVAPTSAIAATP
jgi:hypothetical protein